ncbi:mannitol dehydrogenase family protein [Sphingomonas sp. SRS2]|uniref:mannitol dehydrogenase family protein n=1 Tax=Sphingomonas sp. SRS2 TaxID=133190 RepID=UPI0013649315|nr:mannitol dehydrogenase family protein [Sphingomonas sp. SRS2]
MRLPVYDPAAVRAGIVHIGLGGFHRAHMARYTHELMNLDAGALEWGITGAGLLPGDARLHAALAPQDWLYTLVERGAAGEDVSLIGSLAGMILAAGDSAALLDAMARAETRIVSLTVTSHGYCLSPATKRLDPAHPLIAADLADPEHPHSAVGLIAEACRRRMLGDRPAFTALSCDNIEHNGRVLAQAVLDYAALRSPELAEWIAREARFPSTMVDRITPVTRAGDIAGLAANYGIDDGWPVFSESFTQWVIEDDFADGRPDWDRVGAQFVPDVAPYERMKLRLLNASHLAIAGPARLIGYSYIHEAMGDDLLRRYMAALMERETGPTLLPVPGVDLAAYKATLIDRFANPAIQDGVDRVNADAALNYLLDPIRDRLAAREPIDLLAFGVAAWIRRVRGRDQEGRTIEVSHPLAALLRERAEAGGSDPAPVLAIGALFGNLAGDPVFVASVGKQLASIYAVGMRAALTALARELGF